MTTDHPSSGGGTRQLTIVENTLESEQLFSECREVTIVHRGENYKLRITGNDRLILNK